MAQDFITEKIPGLKVSKVIEVCQGRFFGPSDVLADEITGMQINSQKIVQGNLFCAFKGQNTDGNKFIPNAIDAGAIAAITDAGASGKFPTIKVDNVQSAMAKIATFYRSTLKIPIVAIIGSVGKTSTKEAIASVLQEQFSVAKTSGNLNNELGLPITMLSIKPAHEVAVVEMGISDFGEMTRLTKITRPDVLVFTNVGEAHLEKLVDKAGVLRAKSEAFNYMNPGATVILNGDDEMLKTVKTVNGKAPFTFGLSDGCNTKARCVKNLGLSGFSGELCIRDNSSHFELGLPGKHAIYNMLAAASVGDALGMPLKKITKGIKNSKNIQGHGTIEKCKSVIILNEAYNANPSSMRASLDLLESAPSPKIAILGEMGELGKDSKSMHESLGAYIASKQIDELVLVGEKSKCTLHGFTHAEGKFPVSYFATKQEAISNLSSFIKPGASILVKSCNSLKFSDIVAAIKSVLNS